MPIDPSLERAYTPSSHLDPAFDYAETYAVHSAASRALPRTELDLAYGASAAERIDLFLPSRPAAPLQVFLHGGYWQELGRRHSAFAARNFVEAGAAFAAVGYPLAPEASLEQIVQAACKALAWLHANANRFELDSERIYITGHSAGAQLVGMLLASDWRAGSAARTPPIRGACVVSGLFDLEPLLYTTTNRALGLGRQAAERNSPLRNLPEVGCPLIVAHGEHESEAFKEQSRAYATAWRDRGFPCHYVELEGRHHFDAVLELMHAESTLSRLVFGQMRLEGPVGRARKVGS